jgi:SpoIID/LytB domain protein
MHSQPLKEGRIRHFRAIRAVLAATAVTAGALAAVTVTAAPASAWASPNVDLTGHGYGHGRGMGQWGAYGYAVDYGWTYTQILNHYYGGTSVQSVGLAAMTVDLSGLDGSGSVTVSSGAAFTVGGLSVPARGAAKISYVAANSFRVQLNSTGCGQPMGGAHAVTTAVARSSVAAPTSLTQMLTVCDTARTYRGTISLTYGGGATRVVNTLSMDDYLRGVVPRESPASWGDSGGGKGMAALQSQAVAARSYAAVSSRYSWARICDSQNCQVYGGAGLDGSLIEDSRTNTAVSTTSAKVLVSSAGAVVSAEYSSSTGGWTAGGTFPAVQDLGDVEAPNHNWTASVSAATVGSTFGVGTLQSITVTRNGLGADGGRVLSATVKGSAGSNTVSGAEFASDLGLKSDWFTVKAPQVPTLYYSNSNARPNIDATQQYGLAGDRPLACDVNGDGTDTPVVYRQSTHMFYLATGLGNYPSFTTVNLGSSGDVPICGDWDGNGTDTMGVYRPSTARFYLLNTNQRAASTPLIQVLLGGLNFVPVAGDWDADGKDTVGAFDPVHDQWWLVNSLHPGAPRTVVNYGLAGDVPVTGDWTAANRDSIGVFRGGHQFLLANRIGGPVSVVTNFGLAGDRPVTGDWNHDKIDTIGVGRGY